ncbi:hypothetical protein AVEN_250873-1 [Araneus ventricosus]|uniref:Retrovirus-related Pol polyprotein from transposon TNT 1-94 n=1 Tax=Araneus ventricosus TaxID=182803 RepID=A0A4Y2IN54_ARAVE|nr:hypothetical protein AVEN_250873-1 [Araneus ventricosus]
MPAVQGKVTKPEPLPLDASENDKKAYDTALKCFEELDAVARTEWSDRERENRILVEAARSMLHAKTLPDKLWAEAVNTAAYVLNRTGPTPEAGKSPYEIRFKSKHSADHLQIFDTECFIHIPKQLAVVVKR